MKKPHPRTAKRDEDNPGNVQPTYTIYLLQVNCYYGHYSSWLKVSHGVICTFFLHGGRLRPWINEKLHLNIPLKSVTSKIQKLRTKSWICIKVAHEERIRLFSCFMRRRSRGIYFLAIVIPRDITSRWKGCCFIWLFAEVSFPLCVPWWNDWKTFWQISFSHVGVNSFTAC